MSDNFPTLSIVTPTLNSMRTLPKYFESVANQQYPIEKIEIIIVDGGSNDKTLEYIEEFKKTTELDIIIVNNKLVTGEAGKAKGVKLAKNELIALIDSDNVLPSSEWITKMVLPFTKENIFGSEPLEYSYRKSDSIINRYCALIGMNDPLCHFLGNYDRKNYLSMKWTSLPVKGCFVNNDSKSNMEIVNYFKIKDSFDYIVLKLTPETLPTIGANGIILKKELLINSLHSEYLFDIDVIYNLVTTQSAQFAKVNIGIIHLFADSFRIFYQKQNRRIRDYLYYTRLKKRSYPWRKNNLAKTFLFILSCIFIIPLLWHVVIGFRRKPDTAWFSHPLLCWITLFAYCKGSVIFFLTKKNLSRKDWKQ